MEGGGPSRSSQEAETLQVPRGRYPAPHRRTEDPEGPEELRGTASPLVPVPELCKGDDLHPLPSYSSFTGVLLLNISRGLVFQLFSKS